MKNCELQRIYKTIEQLGYRKVRAANGHWKIYTPEGRFIATGISRDGDPRSVRNLRGDLRRSDPRLKGVL